MIRIPETEPTNISSIGGDFKNLLFSPQPGEMIQCDEHIFQMGWFNHQLVHAFMVCIVRVLITAPVDFAILFVNLGASLMRFTFDHLEFV